MHRWTKKETRYIKSNYKKCTVKEIADALGMSEASVRNKALRLGIKSKRIWTDRQNSYVENNYGIESISTIAKKIGKTEKQVISKAGALGLGYFREQTENLTLAEMSRLLGRHKNTVKYWVDKHNIPSSKLGKYRMIAPDDLKAFMQAHPELWNACDCDIYYFNNEPWFHEKLLADRKIKFDARWAV